MAATGWSVQRTVARDAATARPRGVRPCQPCRHGMRLLDWLNDPETAFAAVTEATVLGEGDPAPRRFIAVNKAQS